ncbi:MAG: hypothetical protein RQ748_05360 [Elusimicrobiales bacterium]|nr:hypothetical protein [Elusimicrobiales bacterium]
MKKKSRVGKVYRGLLKAFGPQGWWPVTPGGAVSPVYTPLFYGARSDAEIAEICAGAILTQNTAWTNVGKALAGLHGAGLLSAERIAACRLPRLAALIRPSGYYRQKARRLRDFFARAAKEHPEGLERWFRSAPAEALRRELISYKGVGPETADSIVLYAAGRPSFVIDAYSRRIGERLGLGRGGHYDYWKALFEAGLPRRPEVYNEYHALLVKLGKDFCRKTLPLCCGCPLRRECDYAAVRRKDHGKDRSSARQGRIQKGSVRH